MIELKDDAGNVVASVMANKSSDANCNEGVWVTLHCFDGSRPTLTIVNRKDAGFYLGVYRDVNKANAGCDLAISFGDKGPEIQAVRGSGPDDIVIVNLFDLLFANRFVGTEKKDA